MFHSTADRNYFELEITDSTEKKYDDMWFVPANTITRDKQSRDGLRNCTLPWPSPAIVNWYVVLISYQAQSKWDLIKSTLDFSWSHFERHPNIVKHQLLEINTRITIIFCMSSSHSISVVLSGISSLSRTGLRAGLAPLREPEKCCGQDVCRTSPQRKPQ